MASPPDPAVVAAVFDNVCADGMGSASQDPDASTWLCEEPWRGDLWRAVVARADEAGLPVKCDLACVMFEDNLDGVAAGVWLLHPWTRMSKLSASIFKLPWPPGGSALESWRTSKRAGPPADAARADPAAVEASYRTLLRAGEVSAPPFHWEGAFSRRRRRRRWRKHVALPWLMALITRADAEGRHLSATHVWAKDSDKAIGLKVCLLDPETRHPVTEQR